MPIPKVPNSEREFLADVAAITDWPVDLADAAVRGEAVKHLLEYIAVARHGEVF